MFETTPTSILRRMANVPATRGEEPGGDVLPGVNATKRDLRWYRHTGRGTLVALGGEVLLSFGLTGLHPHWYAATMAALALWWITGIAGLARRGVRMGRNMAVACSLGMVTWRQLPQPDRERMRPVAAELLASGNRHDRDQVRRRLLVLHRAAVRAQARHAPGWDDDIVAAEGWMDGMDEASRDA